MKHNGLVDSQEWEVTHLTLPGDVVTQTDTHTHTKVNTVGTLSRFQEFSFNLSSRIGPIIVCIYSMNMYGIYSLDNCLYYVAIRERGKDWKGRAQ